MVEQERGGRLSKLDELSSHLKRVERIALDNSVYLDENIRIHALWTAIRSVSSRLNSTKRTPFREELRVLRHLGLAREDPVIKETLENIEKSDVPDIGVEPLADLTTWFTTSVVPRVSQVSLLPDDAPSGVIAHLASNFLSSFRFQRHGLVEGDDALSVLARAEWYLNEKNLDAAAREVNQLKGSAKALAKDWLDAARRRLEVEQALEIVQTQATLSSLLIV
jgi:MICOS complex subunit MIC60